MSTEPGLQVIGTPMIVLCKWYGQGMFGGRTRHTGRHVPRKTSRDEV